jgi:CheY-like chemotaxis protein
MEPHVLIVDDSPAMRSFIRRVLELSGLEVGRCLEASNGEEALRLLEGGNEGLGVGRPAPGKAFEKGLLQIECQIQEMALAFDVQGYRISRFEPCQLRA